MNHVILLVDDEPAALRGMLRNLHATSLDFVTVNSAAEAIDRLEHQRIDVIVTDERMPGMSGHELLEIVAKRWPATVRIMLTGETDAEVVRRAINQGHVHQFLLKPCVSATLMSAMSAALQRIDLERAARELLRAAHARPDRQDRAVPRDLANEPAGDGAWHLEPPAAGFDELIRSMQTASSTAAAAPSMAQLEVAVEGWRTIVDLMDDVVCLIDRDGRVTRVNRAFEGWGLGDVRSALGRDAHEVLHGSCTASDCELACWIQNVVMKRDGGGALEFVDPILQRRVRLRQSPASEGPGQDPRWLLVLRDVTSDHELRAESVRLQAQLAQSQKLEAIGRLAAGVAHEINTPAQFVRDNLEFLQTGAESLREAAKLHQALLAAVQDGAANGDLAAAQKEALAKLDVDFVLREVVNAATEGLEGINRIANIVRALKEFSHPGGGELGKIDLRRAIESTVTVARNEWKYVARVETTIDPDLPEIDGFAGELNQVFLNLLVNAAHAIGEKSQGAAGATGHIRIRARRDGESVEIRFEDDGAGIPEAIRRKVFEPFFTTKPMGKGTGQGLALARNVIIGQHKGSIDFESKVGEGTTFILRMPIAAATAEAAPMDEVPADNTSGVIGSLPIPSGT
jgi:signal transduction histidine kinase/FixJ family two-component response regulator